VISCRWCGATCEIVLDLGEQPAADHFPLPTDPLPDAAYPLRMALCRSCGLAQLAEDATVPDEPRGVEPAASRAQAEYAVRRLVASGILVAGATVREFDSPHSGSWAKPLTRAGLLWRSTALDVAEPSDVVVDVFGLMHEPDQMSAVRQRCAAVRPDGVLLIQFHSLSAILRHGQWNALRHGHFAYHSLPALVQMLADSGLRPIAGWQFDLYGGTVLLAAARTAEGAVGGSVATLLNSERASGVVDAAAVAKLADATATSAEALRRFLHDEQSAGRRVFGYGAASRAVALLAVAGADRDLLPAVADAAPAKQGRCLPGSRIPIIAPADLVAQRPDRVLVLVPDLVDEVRRALPEVEASGGRWVVAEPTVSLVGP